MLLLFTKTAVSIYIYIYMYYLYTRARFRVYIEAYACSSGITVGEEKKLQQSRAPVARTHSGLVFAVITARQVKRG